MGLLAAGMVIVFAGFVAACSSPPPEPRSYFVFMEDDLAREGVLARCNQDRDATASNVECTNARRAAATLALEQERVRSERLAHESERKLLAMRARDARETAVQQSDTATATGGAVAAFGAPVGAVLPSMSESAPLEVYAEPNGQSLGPPEFQVAAAEPPASEVPIARPDLEFEDLDAIPRPFRADEALAVSQ